MPVNKNAYLRYQLLDQCFSNKYRKFDIARLLDFVSDKLGYTVSLRQIREDIANLRLGPYYAPIEATPYDGKKCYYHYSDPDFSIFKQELSIEELANLRSTIEMLGRYRCIPANAWLEEVISNLEYRMGIKVDRENVIDFEHNDRLKGIEHLTPLIDATVNHQPLEITYKSYKGNEQTNVLHPYYIKEYNGRWFLYGFNETYRHISNYALDRIKAFHNKDIPFIKNTSINFEDCFRNIIGVTIPEDNVSLEKVVLRFTPERFPYVLSKPIHPSQTVTDAGACEIAITVKPTRELRQQIFSFIPDVVVISPQWLRDEIRGKIAENLNKYQTMQNSCTEHK